jgi:hypothetical protein
VIRTTARSAHPFWLSSSRRGSRGNRAHRSAHDEAWLALLKAAARQCPYPLGSEQLPSPAGGAGPRHHHAARVSGVPHRGSRAWLHLRALWSAGHYENMISNRKGDNALAH